MSAASLALLDTSGHCVDFAGCYGQPSDILYGNFECYVSPPGAVCNGWCDGGTYGVTNSTCGADGQWGPVEGACVPGMYAMRMDRWTCPNSKDRFLT